jgi:F-type H+-transporting ATPase subunit a
MKKWRTWLIVLGFLGVLVGLYLIGWKVLDNKAALLQAHMHIPRPRPEPVMIFHVGGREIPIVNTVFSSFLAMVVLVILAGLVSRGLSRIPEEERIRRPRGWQNLVEWAVEYVINLLEGAAGRARFKKRPLGRMIFPLVGTLFVFIIFANWFSLLPGFSTILVKAPEAVPATAGEAHAEATESGEGTHAEPFGLVWLLGREQPGEAVPLLRAPNSHLAVTAGMAIVAIVTVQGLAIAAHGPIGYLKHLATDAPIWMRFIMFPIHVVSELSRVISLSARLFGNLYGGDVLLAVIFNLVGIALPAIFFGIEAFFYYIQALLFSVLTTVYIVLAVGGAHAEEHAH